MKPTPAFHPVLIAVYPILSLAAHNRSEVPASWLLGPCLLSAGLAGVMLLAGRFLLGSSAKIGLFVSAFFVLFFSYGPVYEAVASLGAFWIVRHSRLIGFWLVLLLLAGLLIARMRRDLSGVTRFLNVASVVLVVMPALTLVYSIFDAPDVAGRRPSAPVSTARTPEARPDIYYIILDGYANGLTLEELYGYSNEPFLSELERRGFFVARESCSNYPYTVLSISSALNMNYLDKLATAPPGGRDQRPLADLIKNNRVWEALQPLGYEFVNVSSGAGPTNQIRSATNFVGGYAGLNEFTTVLLRSTALLPLLTKMFGGDVRSRVLFSFGKVADVAQIKKPTFTLMHIISPHPPFVFGRNGESIEQTKLDLSDPRWLPKEQYLDQLIFISKKALVAIDDILARSPSPPIIVLQSDHGPASLGLMQPRPELFKERMRILNAYYLPGEGAGAELYPSISPVNTFRVILAQYFSIEAELLPDRSFFSPLERPYDFNNLQDVTEFARFSDEPTAAHRPIQSSTSSQIH